MKPPLEQNYYELLEVPRDATTAELDRAYERARAYYGDGSVAIYALTSSEELKLVQGRIDEAYLILSDEKARAEYDARIGPPSPDERPLHREVRMARERESAREANEHRRTPAPISAPAPAPVAAPPPVVAPSLSVVPPVDVLPHPAANELAEPTPISDHEIEPVEVAAPIQTEIRPPPLPPRPTLVESKPSQPEAVAVAPVAESEPKPEPAPTPATTPTAPTSASPNQAGLVALAEVEVVESRPPPPKREISPEPAPAPPSAPVQVPTPATPLAFVESSPADTRARAEPVTESRNEIVPAPSVALSHSPERIERKPELLPSRASEPAGPPQPPPMELPEPEPVEPVPPPRAAPRPVAKPPEPRGPPKPVDLPGDAFINGELLRKLREQQGLSIQDLVDRTKISRSHLENIEADRYGVLPPQVYLRGFLISYARELRIDPLRVAKGYLEQIANKGGGKAKG
jgi:hypothetical protein